MKNFNWDKFKKGELAVECITEEDMWDFLAKCEERGILWTSGNKPTQLNYYYEEPIYFHINNKTLYWGEENYANRITWIIEKSSPKSGYSWREVFANIQEGETYEYENKFISYEDGCLKIGDSTGCLSLSEEDLFNIKKKPRQADFQEVQIALNEGKTVKSSFGRFYKLEEAERLVGSFDLDYWEGCDLTFYEITNEWYIIE